MSEDVMVERLIKVLNVCINDDLLAGETYGLFSIEDLRKIARVVIEAMREPTEAMIESGAEAIWGDLHFGGDFFEAREFAKDAWLKMNDAARGD